MRLECREKRRHLWQNTAHQIRPLVNSNMARGMASIGKKDKKEVKIMNFKKFRQSKGLTLNEMATLLKCSKSFYEKVEYGARKPTRKFMNNFKKAFPDFDMNIFFL